MAALTSQQSEMALEVHLPHRIRLWVLEASERLMLGTFLRVQASVSPQDRRDCARGRHRLRRGSRYSLRRWACRKDCRQSCRRTCQKRICCEIVYEHLADFARTPGCVIVAYRQDCSLHTLGSTLGAGVRPAGAF